MCAHVIKLTRANPAPTNVGDLGSAAANSLERGSFSVQTGDSVRTVEPDCKSICAKEQNNAMCFSKRKKRIVYR